MTPTNAPTTKNIQLTENQRKRGMKKAICPVCGTNYKGKFLKKIVTCGKCHWDLGQKQGVAK